MAVKAESKAPVTSLVHEASAEGVISHVVYGVDGFDNDHRPGRFNVLSNWWLKPRNYKPVKTGCR